MSGPNADEWRRAWRDKLNTITKMGAWTEAERHPPNVKLLTVKPVFRVKTQDGRVTGFKVRCTIRGCAQWPAAHYDETFQPVSRTSSLRLLLCLAATHDLEVYTADFDAAYLNADIDQDIFIRVPPGYQPENPKTKCLHLRKSVYGLKQAGNLWWRQIEDALSAFAFTCVQSEWSHYTLRRGGQVTMTVLLYVDDLAVLCSSKSHADSLFRHLRNCFPLTELGPISHLLDIKITRDRAKRTVEISQPAFVDTLVDALPTRPRAGGGQARSPARSPTIADT